MAITIDYSGLPYTINVPRADMLLLQSVPTEIRQLDVNAFRLELKDLEDDENGMHFPRTHNHNTTVLLGGVNYARTVEILDPYQIEFEDGQYAVNLTGANNNILDKTLRNQVSVAPNNSAGLQDLSTLLQAAYNNEVCVDVLNGQAGTSTPLGTRGKPVDNFADAATIAANNSISTIRLLGDATIANVSLGGLRVAGDSATISCTIDATADVEQCSFSELTVSGTLDGDNEFRGCLLTTINYVNGFIFECALSGTITLGGSAQLSILDCWSNVAGGGVGQYPTVDMGGSGNSLALRNFSGGIAISNYSGGGAVSVDMASGRVVMQSTVTAGDITIRGVADVQDDSTGSAVVNDLTLNQRLGLIESIVLYVRKLLSNKVSISGDDSTTTIYDDDKTTPILVFNHSDARNRDPQ